MSGNKPLLMQRPSRSGAGAIAIDQKEVTTAGSSAGPSMGGEEAASTRRAPTGNPPAPRRRRHGKQPLTDAARGAAGELGGGPSPQ